MATAKTSLLKWCNRVAEFAISRGTVADVKPERFVETFNVIHACRKLQRGMLHAPGQTRCRTCKQGVFKESVA